MVEAGSFSGKGATRHSPYTYEEREFGQPKELKQKETIRKETLFVENWGLWGRLTKSFIRGLVALSSRKREV